MRDMEDDGFYECKDWKKQMGDLKRELEREKETRTSSLRNVTDLKSRIYKERRKVLVLFRG